MKLFRKIRQRLIKEGNLKRYLLYAVGEILLVMIGISLAFQVNKWNDNRTKKNTEIRYYETIKNQIVDDKALIERQKEFNARFMGQFEYAIAIIEADDRSKLDTLGLIIRNLPEYSDLDKQGNIYETMVNSGEIKLLRNHDIINGIRELEENYIYINRMENIHYDIVMDHIAPNITPVLKYSTGEIKKPDVVYSYEFQNLIVLSMRVMKEKDNTYSDAIHEIDYVISLLNEELNPE